MNPHVNCQLRSLVESCPTLGAAKRLLLRLGRVGSHVVSDVTLKCFSTDVTFVQTLALVEGEYVSFESIRPGVCLQYNIGVGCSSYISNRLGLSCMLVSK